MEGARAAIQDLVIFEWVEKIEKDEIVLFIHEANERSYRPSPSPDVRPLTCPLFRFHHDRILCPINGYALLPLRDALDLPNHTDMTRTNLSRLITTDQLSKAWPFQSS